jgi:hypothetical protein
MPANKIETRLQGALMKGSMIRPLFSDLDHTPSVWFIIITASLYIPQFALSCPYKRTHCHTTEIPIACDH